ncbi:hypothetical protein Tco_1056268 [Tanacetum coccineum]|uniref:Uncharacterized protein n=1 Tax=Tanacetum coccineum TaxID=301880 RepID=A0ABQ5H351_9ASTR
MDVAPLHLHYWDYSNQIMPKAAYLLASRSQHATMQHSALANMLWKFPIAAGMILEVSRTFSVSFTRNMLSTQYTSHAIPDDGILRRLEAFVASPIGCGGSDVRIS